MKRRKEGYSKIRNEAIAHAFSYMKLMEHWGSGIPRIIECVVEAGLKEPEFIDGDVDLRINIYRGQIGDVTNNVTNNVTNGVTDKSPEEAIIAMIEADSMVTQVKMAEALGVTTRTVKRILAKIQETGMVTHEGTSRSGKWVINRK